LSDLDSKELFLSSSQALYTQIFAKLRTLHPDTHRTRLAN